MKKTVLKLSLVFSLLNSFVDSSSIDCRKGWTASTYENGQLLCVKAFFKSYSFSFEIAKEICSNEDAFVAPMLNEQQEISIREAASAEVPEYSWYTEPMYFYLAAQLNKNSSTFRWLYNNATVLLNGTTFIRKSGLYREMKNCLKFEWNNKNPSSLIVLEQTDCDCVLQVYCIGRNRGVICAKFSVSPTTTTARTPSAPTTAAPTVTTTFACPTFDCPRVTCPTVKASPRTTTAPTVTTTFTCPCFNTFS